MIVNNDINMGFSVCIGGTYNGSNAILTAGHDNKNNHKYYKSGNQIGQVSYVQCSTSPYGFELDIPGALCNTQMLQYSIQIEGVLSIE